MTRATFLLPFLIGLTSLIGLVAALTGDGVRDAIAWIALAIPIAAVAWARIAQKF